MKKFNFTLAQITCGFYSDNHAFIRHLVEHYGVFATDEKSEIEIKIITKEKPFFKNHFSQGILFKSQDYSNIFTGPSIYLKLSTRTLKGTFMVMEDLKIFDIGLRALFSRLLPLYNGMLIHSCAIADKERGFLFYGPSNGGKTTVSRISDLSGKRVMSDELAAVRKIKGKYYVFGTPFWGEFQGKSTNTGIELGAIFQLVKSNCFRIGSVNPAESVAPIMQSILNFSNDFNVSKTFLDLIFDLNEHIPLKRIEFRKTDNIWKEMAE